MHPNQQLIQIFYTAFQQKDYKTMQATYANTATFSDAAFQNLNAQEVRAMWEMLLKQGKDLQLEFKDVVADDKNGSATWVATYTFSKTNRKVVNYIQANFVFQNGKIVEHRDSFNFYTWAKQAFGLTGTLIGWTPFFQNKVRSTAKQSLLNFMAKNKS